MKAIRHKGLIHISVLAFFLLAFGCAGTSEKQAPAQNIQTPVLNAINITDNQVNIAADKAFTFTIYKAADPYKVIVELPNVSLGIPQNTIKSDKAGITEITASQVKEPLTAKIEILLASPVGVESLYKDAVLTVKVKEEPAAKTEEKPVQEQKVEVPRELPPVEVPKELSPATEITQLNIEKEENLVKLLIKGNGSLNPQVFRLDNRAVLDMPNIEITATIPSQVPSPLKSIRAGKHTDKTRLVIDLKEGTTYDVASLEDSVIIEFHISDKVKSAAKKDKPAEPVETKTVVTEPEKPVEGKYKGQKISLDFQDAEIGPIFRLLADISGYNFVIDPAVKGRITMKLMNVPWDQALDIILQTFSLGKSVDGNIIWIAPVTMFSKMADEKSKAKDAEERAEDLLQKVIRINYATASEISTAINQGKLLSSRGSVTVDNRMNTLIVKDSQTSIDKIKELVKIMDVAKPQVMIEAKIVEVSSTYSEQLGIRWGGNFVGANINTMGQSITGNFSVNTPVAVGGASTTNPGGVLGLTIGAASTAQVTLSLSALESVGKSKKLSNPKILTMDNEAATIQQGTSVPVQTTSAEGTKTEYVNATLKLAVTPKITPEGYVQMKIDAANDSLGILTPQGYAIEKKSVQTQALVKNGETLVIGGIYTTSTVEAEEGLPWLSRIPILGWLFKTKTQSGPNITELLIFITPTVVNKP